MVNRIKFAGVIRNVAWLDERPFCSHLIASWRAGRDIGERCKGYNPIGNTCSKGGLCAMADPDWIFLPGWDRYVKWHEQEHGYVTMEVWPGLRQGMIFCYQVDGDCMKPTYWHGDFVVVQKGSDGFKDGTPCVFQLRKWGIPLAGHWLKRLTRVTETHYLVSADGLGFDPVQVPVEDINITAVVLEGTRPEDVIGELELCHCFDGDGRIVARAAMKKAQAGLQAYYPEDIRNALLAAEQATSAALQATGEHEDLFAAGYTEGYRAAMTTVALAFGLVQERPDVLRVPQRHPTLASWAR